MLVPFGLLLHLVQLFLKPGGDRVTLGLPAVRHLKSKEHCKNLSEDGDLLQNTKNSREGRALARIDPFLFAQVDFNFFSLFDK